MDSLDSYEAVRNSLEKQIAHLADGSHACLVYSTPEEQMRTFVAFFREGKRRHEQCLYIVDASDAAERLGGLKASGIDARAAIDRGALHLLTARETYLRDGRFDPDAMIAFLLATAENARANGWTGLRVVGEMSWAMGPDIDSELFIEYEARLNALPRASGLRLVCQYDRRDFRPEIIRDVLRTHPLAIVGDHVHDNPYFEPLPLVLGGPDVERRRVDWMLDQLRKRSHRASAVAELGAWALAHVAHAEVMNAAAHIMSRELGAEYVELIEFPSNGDAIRRVASAGFQLFPPGALKLKMRDVWIETNGVPRHKLLLVPDWSQETRISLRAELQAHGITGSMGVPIGIPDEEQLRGIVWVHSVAPRIYSEDEIAFAETIAIVLAQAMARTQAEQEFQTVIQNAPEIIARFDRDLRHTYVNPAVERITGVSASTLVGKTSREAGLSEALGPSWELVLRQAWRTGREQVTEATVPTPSGDRQFQTRILPEFGPDGLVQSLLSISRDVTEQRQAEAERAALYRGMIAQQNQLTELTSRLEQDRGIQLQRVAQAVQADHLTPRQREVLQLLAKGWTNPEIAAELRLTRGTVKNHVAKILSTLDASDRTQAAVRAVELGITSSD